MNEPLRIPADMIQSAPDEPTTVSIRDMLILLGTSDEKLRDMDERDEILAREPWRDQTKWVEWPGQEGAAYKFGHIEGRIDWSGTRFENDKPTWSINEGEYLD